MSSVPPVDVLSDVLRVVRLRGALYFDFTLAAPWVAAAPPSSEAAPLLMPGTDHMIEYHVLAAGSCWVAPKNQDPVQLDTGDLVVFPRGSSHVLSSSPGARGRPQMELFRKAYTAPRLPFVVQGRTDHVDARIICGFLGCDAYPFNPLLHALPEMIVLRAAAAGRDDWLATFLSIALTEGQSLRAGSQNMLSRVGELMFTEAIRRHLESLGAQSSGWLAGLRDRAVGRVLALLHGEPARAWTLEELAAAAAVSRSVMAERFTQLVGHPPMQYLALWRMQIAAQALLTSNASIAQVASQVGYESEAAFSRAFRKIVGKPPATWRGERLRAEQAP